ncbi:MAG: SRPBCC domain-containing protein [Bacteroidia bacterium]|nr:SRPBCC domain-containing protein [Bacteroidia bacterium]
MSKKDFTYSFESSKPTETIFETLLDVKKWWFGFYEERITGKSKKVNDEFNFKAGGGMHDTTQKLVELIPDKKITWLVTASNLTFLKKPSEWLNTKFYFELAKAGSKTKIIFTHQGLNPAIECYNDCSLGWTHYLKQLENTLK